MVAETEVEFITLCDSAQSVNGKLFMLGAGWSQTVRFVPVGELPDGQAPPPTQFAIACCISVGWNDSNTVLPLEITIEDADGKQHFQLVAQMTAGRPPAPGPVPLRATLAVPIQMAFPKAGDYCVRARIVSLDTSGANKVCSFAVIDQPVIGVTSNGPARPST